MVLEQAFTQCFLVDKVFGSGPVSKLLPVLPLPDLQGW